MAGNVVSKIGESAVVAGVYRLSVPIMLAALAWFLADLVGEQRKAIDATASQVDAISGQVASLSNRVTAIEAGRTVALEENRIRWAQTIVKLDELAKGQADTVARIAALAATTEAVKDRLDSQLRRLGSNAPLYREGQP